MPTQLEEPQGEKSQSISVLFLGGLVVLFNCGMVILGVSLNSSHKYNNHELTSFITIMFKINSNTQLNSTKTYCNRSIDTCCKVYNHCHYKNNIP